MKNAAFFYYLKSIWENKKKNKHQEKKNLFLSVLYDPSSHKFREAL
jgi:hypothetical protein